MAVVTRLSTLVSNYEAQPRVLNSGYLAGATDTIGTATVGAVSTDSIASVYKFGFLPSGVLIENLNLMNDATTAGVWKFGVYTNDNQSLDVGRFGGGVSAPPIATWNSTTAYVPGNVVILAGVIYYCTTGNTNSQPPSGNWTTGGSQVVAPGSVVVPNSDQIFATGVSTAAAKTVYTAIYSPSIGAVGFAAANATLRVWELMGFANDPLYEFLLVATATTAPTANGNITLQYSWLR